MQMHGVVDGDIRIQLHRAAKSTQKDVITGWRNVVVEDSAGYGNEYCCRMRVTFCGQSQNTHHVFRALIPHFHP